MANELPLIPGTLPAPYTCYQALYEQMFSLGAAQGPTVTGILIQDATPAAEDHDKGWIPTAGGVPRYPGYVFVWHATLGHWVSRHYIADSDKSRRIYVGLSTDIATYDGGDSGALGPASGPMWERDVLFDGRVPIGVGTIPTSSPAASVAAALDTTDSLGNSGEYKHALTPDEMKSHFHGVGTDGEPGGGDPPVMLRRDWTVANAITTRREDIGGTETWADGAPIATGLMGTTDPLSTGNASDAHNTMPPWIGVFMLKRTSRQFYVAA